MKLMKTSQKKKDWEQIITSVIFYAEGQIRMGYYDVQDGVFVQSDFNQTRIGQGHKMPLPIFIL